MDSTCWASFVLASSGAFGKQNVVNLQEVLKFDLPLAREVLQHHLQNLVPLQLQLKPQVAEALGIAADEESADRAA